MLGSVIVKRRTSSKTDRSERAQIVDQADGGDSRFFIYLLFSFLHRADRERRAPLQGDLDLAIIAEAVAIAAIDPRMRDPQFRQDYGRMSQIVGIEGQRGVNALSIAASTGLPRETTRRKIKRLVELGIVVEVSRGKYVMKPGYLQTPAIRGTLDNLARETVRFINECLDNGVLKLAPQKPGLSNPDLRD